MSSDDRDDVCGRVSCDDVRSIDELCDVLVHDCVSDDVCNHDCVCGRVSHCDTMSSRMLLPSRDVPCSRVLCRDHLMLPRHGSVPGCQGDTEG